MTIVTGKMLFFRFLVKTSVLKTIVLLGLIISFLLISCSQAYNEDNKKATTMKLRASFCDPLKSDIIELGDILQDTIIDHFEKINWNDYLQKMINAKPDEIYYSPSFEVENKESENGLTISAVGDPNNYEFYIFYKRPKKVKSFFGDDWRKGPRESILAMIINYTTIELPLDSFTNWSAKVKYMASEKRE